MAVEKFDRAAWIEDIARCLSPLVESMTAIRINLPPLSNSQYRTLWTQANIDDNARAIFDLYLPKLNADPFELVDLLLQNPAIKPNVSGAGRDIATFVEMPSKGFLMELHQLACYLTRYAIKRGCRGAAVYLEEFLTCCAEGRVQGNQITVFRGLKMSGEAEIAPGVEIISYKRATERQLVKDEDPDLRDDDFDYQSMDALVLVREMTWDPCLVQPRSSRDTRKNPTPTFRWVPGHDLSVIFDLLSIVTSHRIQTLSLLCCAPQLVELNPNFGPGSSTGFLHTDNWTKKEFKLEYISELQKLLCAWARFEVNSRETLQLALSRLASSVNRDRGRFWAQDRILDAAIALEMMYELKSPEITFKLATRAGHFLADKSNKPINLFDQVMSFYSARSSIAHGGKIQGRKRKENLFKDAAESGFNLAWKTFRTLLDNGEFPDWKRLVLTRSAD